MIAATDSINRLFSNNIIPFQAARRFGLWGVSKLPPLKRFFMKHAMGLVGDLPESVKKSADNHK
jgi:2-octaprenyl-6-methoxyphenol hydroxylase